MSAKNCRQFSDDSENRLTSRSLPEVRDAIEGELLRIKRSKVARVGSSPWNITTVINSVLVGYLRLPIGERDKLLADGAGELRRLINLPEQGSIESSSVTLNPGEGKGIVRPVGNVRVEGGTVKPDSPKRTVRKCDHVPSWK